MKFGRIQMRIMQVLWEKGRASSQEITRALNEFEPIVFKNVQTLLRALEKKGAIGHDVDNRSHLYYPVVSREKALKSVTHDMIDRLFGGSVISLVSSIIKDRSIPPDEFRKISEILEKKEKKH
jgi:BlaI family transcriptional regulator, penicillinase repressor